MLGHVGVGVRDVEGDVADDQVGDAGTLGARRRDAVHPAQQQRVVGDEQVRPQRARLGDDGQGRVDGQVDAAHDLVGVPGDQPDAVPRLRRVGWVERFEHVEHLTQGQVGVVAHVGPAGIEPTTFAV